MHTPLSLALIAAAALPVTAEPASDVLDFESDHRVFTQHIYYLANDFMEGRVPGSRGAEIARQYAETAFEKAGLSPAFAETITAEDGSETEEAFASWRQPFPLGGRVDVTVAELSAAGMTFAYERDFTVTGLGGQGRVSGDAVFVGYSIDEGNDGFSSYPADADLSGKLAVMLRFEPMDEQGMSLWTEDDSWSNAASFNGKIRAALDRGAAGVVVINTPGAADERVNRLDAFRGSGMGADEPVFMMSKDAGTKWLEAATGMDVADLIAKANEGGAIMDLNGGAELAAQIDREIVFAENVGGVLWGQGDLKDEWIVMGAHIDHIGMGDFGSRWGSGQLHPGADDNASGTAGVLLLADLLSQSYANLPEDADARSIVFIAFDAEESGLNGSRYYVNNPIAPLDDHAIMTNFDMIGRITNNRVLLSGLETGEGLQALLQPAMDKTELELVIPSSMNGASDHSSFLSRGVPVLFSIIADFHDDYHTPADVVWKINTEDATRTCHLYHDMVMILSSSEKPQLVSASNRTPQQSSMGDIKVRFGVSPDYSSDGDGIGIASVAEGGSAGEAGVQEGDRLVRWDGQKLSDVESWMPLLGRHEPGDVVNIGVLRDGQEITLEVTLQAR